MPIKLWLFLDKILRVLRIGMPASGTIPSYGSNPVAPAPPLANAAVSHSRACSKWTLKYGGSSYTYMSGRLRG